MLPNLGSFAAGLGDAALQGNVDESQALVDSGDNFALAPEEASILTAHIPSPGQRLFDRFGDAASSVLSAAPNGGGVPIGKANIPEPFRPFVSILEHGISTMEDLAKANVLLRLIDPELLGHLIDATENVPHTFVKFERAKTGGTVLGAATLGFSRGVERKGPGFAEKISLAILEGTGLDIFVPSHENDHACDFGCLPEAQRAAIEKEDMHIPTSDAPLIEIYRAILKNRLWDEVLAFSTAPRLAQKFQEATGVSIFTFEAQKRSERYVRELADIYDSKGFNGLYEWMTTNPLYLPYKVAALYLAVLIRNGLTEFPNWGELMGSIGVKRDRNGMMSIEPENLKTIYADLIKPNLLSIATFAGGLNPATLKLAQRAAQYFTGGLSTGAAIDFLRNDFEPIVQVVGQAMGDRVASGEGGVAATRIEPAEDETMPPSLTELKKGDPRTITSQPEAVADRLRLTGKFVEYLYRMDQISDNLVIDMWHAFISYARMADPESSARVFSRLIALAKHGNFPNANAFFKSRWRLGLALLQAGHKGNNDRYLAEGVKMLDLSLEKGVQGLVDNIDIDALLELGYGSHVEALFDQLAKENEAAIAAYERDLAESPDEIAREVPQDINQFLGNLSLLKSRKYPGKIPKTMVKKMGAVMERLWAIDRGAMERHIENYRKRYAPQVATFSSVEELTAVNPQWYDAKRTMANDANRLVGGSYVGWTMNSDILDICFSYPELYPLGIRIFRELPESQSKLHYLMELAWSKRLDSRTRSQIEDIQRTTLSNLEAGFRAWAFVQDFLSSPQSKQEHRAAAEGVGFSNTYFYYDSISSLARLMLGSRSSAQRQRGKEILLGMSEDATPYHSVFNGRDSKTRTLFIPALWKAFSIAKFIGEFPKGERPEMARRSFELLKKAGTKGNDSKMKARLLLDLMMIGVQLDTRLAGEIVQAWNGGMEQELLGSIEKVKGGAPKKAFDVRARTIVPLAEAGIAGDERALATLIDRIGNDVAEKRGYFGQDDVISTIEYLSDDDVRKRFKDIKRLDARVKRLSHIAIDLYLQNLGEEKGLQNFVNMFFSPLATALRGLPLTAKDKDDVFAYLIEESTPKKGVALKAADAAEGLLNAASGGEYILGNKKMPRSDALLLDRLADLLEEVDFSVNDRRAMGVANALWGIYRRIADDFLIDPQQRSRFAQLASDETFTDAMKFLFAFTERPPLTEDVDLAAASAKYAEAKSAGAEALQAAASDIKLAIGAELRARREEMLEANSKGSRSSTGDLFPGIGGKNANYLTFDSLDGGILIHVYNDWRAATATKDEPLAEALFDIWAISANDDEVLMKRALHYPELTNPDRPLEVKRRIFKEVTKASDPSKYAKEKWDKLVKAGDTEREAIFYELATPVLYDRAFGKEPIVKKIVDGSDITQTEETFVAFPSDELVALGLEQPITEARKLTERFKRFRAADIHSWRMDPMNTYDWEIYAGFAPHYYNTWVDNMADLFRTFVTISVGKFNAIAAAAEHVRMTQLFTAEEDRMLWRLLTTAKAAWNRNLDPRHSKMTRMLHPYYFTDAPAIAAMFERLPTPEEADELLSAFEQVFRRRDLMKDKINMSLFEMPEAFSDRPEPVQFMLSRYFLNLGVGKEQDLLQIMKGVGRDTALVRLLMQTNQFKLSQVVSTLPNVPEDIRAEAAKALDSVPKSDIGEVTTALEKALLPGADRDSILKNLGLHKGPSGERIPLGSGSIGDVYWSALANGEEVAVKVITGTKETDFLKQLDIYRELRYLLELYFDEKPWARNLHHWMGALFEMVERELDLSLEARTTDEVRSALPQGIGVPEIKKGLLREGEKKVMVMGFAKGEKLSKVSEPATRQALTDKIKQTFMALLLRLGRFSADIHPGNLRYNQSQDILWLLDWGQTGYLNGAERGQIAVAVQAILNKNAALITGLVMQMGVTYKDVDLVRLQGDIEKVLGNGKIDPENISIYVQNIFDAAFDNGILINSPFLVLLKGLFTYENMAKTTLEE